MRGKATIPTVLTLLIFGPYTVVLRVAGGRPAKRTGISLDQAGDHLDRPGFARYGEVQSTLPLVVGRSPKLTVTTSSLLASSRSTMVLSGSAVMVNR